MFAKGAINISIAISPDHKFNTIHSRLIPSLKLNIVVAITIDRNIAHVLIMMLALIHDHII